MTQTDLIKDVAAFRLPYGFRNRKLVWTRQMEGLFQVIELQKSSYSVSYYVNLLVLVEDLIEGDASNDYHLFARLHSLDPAVPEMIDLWDPRAWEEQLALTKAGLIRTELPFLDEFYSLEELCRFVQTDRGQTAFVVGKLEAYCEDRCS